MAALDDVRDRDRVLFRHQKNRRAFSLHLLLSAVLLISSAEALRQLTMCRRLYQFHLIGLLPLCNSLTDSKVLHRIFILHKASRINHLSELRSIS